MKKFTTFIIIVLTPLVLFSQNNSSIDLIIGGDYSNHLRWQKDHEILHTFPLEDLNEEKKGKSNFRAGINYNFPISKKIFLKTGFRIISVGYSTNLNYNDGGQIIVTPTSIENYINDSYKLKKKYIYDYWFIEIPIVLRYELGDKIFVPFIEVGISPNLYITTRHQEIKGNENNIEFRRNKSDQFNKVQMVASISAGVNYNYSSKIVIFGQPTFRFHLTDLTKSEYSNEYLYNFGIETGIRFLIN